MPIREAKSPLPCTTYANTVNSHLSFIGVSKLSCSGCRGSFKCIRRVGAYPYTRGTLGISGGSTPVEKPSNQYGLRVIRIGPQLSQNCIIDPYDIHTAYLSRLWRKVYPIKRWTPNERSNRRRVWFFFV